MKTTKIRQIRKNMILLLTLLVMSIQTTWAQALEKKDITEVCDFEKGTISFTLREPMRDITIVNAHVPKRFPFGGEALI